MRVSQLLSDCQTSKLTLLTSYILSHFSPASLDLCWVGTGRDEQILGLIYPAFRQCYPAILNLTLTRTMKWSRKITRKVTLKGSHRCLNKHKVSCSYIKFKPLHLCKLKALVFRYSILESLHIKQMLAYLKFQSYHLL